SASASSRTNGTGSCVKCAAKPISISAPPPAPSATAEMQRLRLALVPGEPAGVGPELCARALQKRWGARLEVFGDGDALVAAARRIGPPQARNAPHPPQATGREV